MSINSYSLYLKLIFLKNLYIKVGKITHLSLHYSYSLFNLITTYLK